MRPALEEGVKVADRKIMSTARQYLCAAKFWTHCYKGDSVLDPIFYDRPECVSTLRSGVRHVVRGTKHGRWDSPGHGRNQGRWSSRPSPSEMDKAERLLVKNGFLERSGRTVRVTQKGRRVKCDRVNLSPWTDGQYGGSKLSGFMTCGLECGDVGVTRRWRR